MIIGLHKISVEQAKTIAEAMGGKIRLYEPISLEDYTRTLKSYDPRVKNQHLILLKTHYDFAESLTPAQWREYEYFFDLAGGTVWGDPPPAIPETAFTYIGEPVDLNMVVASGQWGADRSILVRGKTKKYFGRASTDPHTILVGYSIDFPASSKPFDYIVTSLPDTSEWWHGVGFIRGLSVIPDKFFEHFDYVNYVAIGPKPSAFLDEKGIKHGSVPSIPAKEYRDNSSNERFGVAIRNAARDQNAITDWTF